MTRVLLYCLGLVTAVGVILGEGAVLIGPQLLSIYSSEAEVIQYGMNHFWLLVHHDQGVLAGFPVVLPAQACLSEAGPGIQGAGRSIAYSNLQIANHGMHFADLLQGMPKKDCGYSPAPEGLIHCYVLHLAFACSAAKRNIAHQKALFLTARKGTETDSATQAFKAKAQLARVLFLCPERGKGPFLECRHKACVCGQQAAQDNARASFAS